MVEDHDRDKVIAEAQAAESTSVGLRKRRGSQPSTKEEEGAKAKAEKEISPDLRDLLKKFTLDE